MELHSRDACASESSCTLQESFASNGREALSCFPAPDHAQRIREAERRQAHPFPIAAPGRNARPWPRPISGRSPCGAPLRSCAGISVPARLWAALPGITGCKREDPLRHQCSEHLAVRSRAGRDDAQNRLQTRATSSARRNRTRSVSRRHRLTSLTMSGMDGVIQIRAAMSKAFRFMQTSRGLARSDSRSAPARTRFTPFKDSPKGEFVSVIQGFRRFANFCGDARRSFLPLGKVSP